MWNNAEINPAGPGYSFGNSENLIGASFVSGSKTMNLNPPQPTSGGLWLGINNPNSQNLAVNSLNWSMYPINLSNYVQSPVVNSGMGQTAAPIYGGHFTLSIGDPYLVSSYAAKILWYIVTSNGYAFTTNSLTTKDLAGLTNLVTNSKNGVFYNSTSVSSEYAQWLLASPNEAKTVITNMTTAASTPITHESIWGKVINGTLKTITNVGIEGIDELSGGTGVVLAGAAKTAVGAFGSDVTDPITAYFTQGNRIKQ